MRLYKIIFTDKEFAEDSIYKLPLFQLEKLKDKVENSDFVEFDIDNTSGFFFSAHEHEFSEFCRMFHSVDIEFQWVDITDKVLLGEKIFTDFLSEGSSVKAELDQLILRFYRENITTDIILDKINSKGMKSLSEEDKLFLQKN